MRIAKVPGANPYWGFFDAPWDKRLQDAWHTVPGMHWEPGLKAWVGYIDAVVMQFGVLRNLGVKVDDSAVPDHWPKRHLETLGPVLEKGPSWNLKDRKLRAYQVEAFRYLLCWGHDGAILADQMGLGKTPVAVTAARAIAGKTVVVTPGYVRGVWWNSGKSGELTKWWPEANVFLAEGVKGISVGAIPEWADVVLLHYGLVAPWLAALLAWGPGVLVLDEGHLGLVGEESARSKAIRILRDRVSFCWALTGTPMTHRPRDMWNLLDIVSPGRFGKNFFNFGKRYCGGYQKEIEALGETRWDFSGASNEEELRKRLTPWMMLRRTATEVALELPAKTRQIIWSDGGKKGENLGRVLAGIRNAKDLRALLDRAADAKLPEIIDTLEDYANDGKRVVVGTYRRAVAETICGQLQSRGVSAGYIHGALSGMARGKTIDRFRQNARDLPNEGSVLVGTLDSCATGVDFSFCQVVCLAEITPDAQELLQFESRAHRYGQKEPVLVQYFLRRGTADELLAERVIEKLDRFEKIVGKVAESDKLFVPSGDDILAEIMRGAGT